jgi:hypothetical protein
VRCNGARIHTSRNCGHKQELPLCIRSVVLRFSHFPFSKGEEQAYGIAILCVRACVNFQTNRLIS